MFWSITELREVKVLYTAEARSMLDTLVWPGIITRALQARLGFHFLALHFSISYLHNNIEKFWQSSTVFGTQILCFIVDQYSNLSQSVKLPQNYLKTASHILFIKASLSHLGHNKSKVVGLRKWSGVKRSTECTIMFRRLISFSCFCFFFLYSIFTISREAASPDEAEIEMSHQQDQLDDVE